MVDCSQIKYASGGTYKGEMKHGRITGKGEFVSCLGERWGSGSWFTGVNAHVNNSHVKLREDLTPS